MPSIIVFGASITYGAWDTQGGWVQRLRSYTDTKALNSPSYHSRVYNLGVSGDTSADIIHRLPELKPRLGDKEAPLFLISVGTNDSQINKKTGQHKTEPKQFKKNIQTIIEKLVLYGGTIAFVGLGPVDETKTDPKPWDPDHSYLNQHIEHYNRLVHQACEEAGVFFIDIYPQLNKEGSNDILTDGVHPNDEGHALMLKTILDFLESKKLI